MSKRGQNPRALPKEELKRLYPPTTIKGYILPELNTILDALTPNNLLPHVAGRAEPVHPLLNFNRTALEDERGSRLPEDDLRGRLLAHIHDMSPEEIDSFLSPPTGDAEATALPQAPAKATALPQAKANGGAAKKAAPAQPKKTGGGGGGGGRGRGGRGGGGAAALAKKAKAGGGGRGGRGAVAQPNQQQVGARGAAKKAAGGRGGGKKPVAAGGGGSGGGGSDHSDRDSDSDEEEEEEEEDDSDDEMVLSDSEEEDNGETHPDDEHINWKVNPLGLTASQRPRPFDHRGSFTTLTYFLMLFAPLVLQSPNATPFIFRMLILLGCPAFLQVLPRCFPEDPEPLPNNYHVSLALQYINDDAVRIMNINVPTTNDNTHMSLAGKLVHLIKSKLNSYNTNTKGKPANLFHQVNVRVKGSEGATFCRQVAKLDATRNFAAPRSPATALLSPLLEPMLKMFHEAW